MKIKKGIVVPILLIFPPLVGLSYDIVSIATPATPVGRELRRHMENESVGQKIGLYRELRNYRLEELAKEPEPEKTLQRFQALLNDPELKAYWRLDEQKRRELRPIDAFYTYKASFAGAAISLAGTALYNRRRKR